MNVQARARICPLLLGANSQNRRVNPRSSAPLMRPVLILGFLVIRLFARADDSFKAGFAEQDITPSKPMPMWGYSSRHDALSQGALDHLYADALVLQVQGKKIALVSLDLGRAPAESTLISIRRRIKAAPGIESSFIAATHTHHGPALELVAGAIQGKKHFDAVQQYYRRLEDAIVRAIVDADAALKPARMAVGAMELDDFNVNRHTGFAPAPRDRDLAVMRLDDTSGKPIAIVVNFAAHPTLVPETVLKFSADYVGAMKQTVTWETGAGVLFMQGAAGDLSAVDQKDYLGFGQDLGHQVTRLCSTLKPQTVEHPSLKVREQRFLFRSRLNLEDSAVRRQCDQLFFPELISYYADEFVRGVQPRLTVAVLNGDIALVGVAGEFFCNHAIRLKERARVKQLFFIGYCNGYDGYFPTIEAAAEGGYGTDIVSSPAAVGSGEIVMDTALIWIYELLGTAGLPSP